MAGVLHPSGLRRPTCQSLVAVLTAVLLLHGFGTESPVANAWGLFSIFAQKTDSLPESAEQPYDSLSCVENTFCESTGDGGFSLGLNATDLGMAQAKAHFHYGKFSVDLKSHCGYTGGTILAFYLQAPGSNSNKDPNHSEIDMEIYGSEDGRQVVFATNIFTGGFQNLVQMHLDLDPSADFHTFTIQWNSRFICWYVNGVPHRILYRAGDKPWPDRPMKAVVSLWDSSSFTTLKSDYTHGPVTARVQGYSSKGCPVPDDKVLDPNEAADGPGPKTSCPHWTDPNLPWNVPLSVGAAIQLADLRRNRLISDYGWDKA